MTQIALGRVVRGVDLMLRQRHGIHDFTDDENCILRISLARMTKTRRLSDGTLVPAGQPVIELHFWNEHLASMPASGPDAAWALRFKRQILHSLALLAHHIECEPRFDDIVALTGTPPFSSRLGAAQMRRTAERFGFEVMSPAPEQELGNRLHMVLDSLLLWGLAWTFNRPGLRSKGLLRHRHELWISRAALHARYRETSPRSHRH